MPAFNARLQPKEIIGMPMPGAIGLAASTALTLFTMIVPGAWKAIPGLFLLCAATYTVFVFWKGERLAWVWIELKSVGEVNCITSESTGEEF